MHIEINDNTTLRQIQETFSAYYPYLKLEFYYKPHKQYEASIVKDLINLDTTIGVIKLTHVSGLLEIQPLYIVSDVEKEFLQRFGLCVQVLKKEKNSWEQTTGMDDFTLKELNEMGRNSSDEFIVSDYEEGFKEEQE
jgi:glycerol-3-phosphate O-acyltransferase